MKKSILLSIGLLALVSSCKNQQQYSISKIKGSRIELSKNTVDTLATSNKDADLLIKRYKTILDAEMDKEIGQSAQAMPLGRPQSLLTNFTSDAMLEFGKERLGQCDLALMNVHGHRADMPKGRITIGNMFEIYSFDNMLTIIKIKGTYVKELLESYAKMGGAGISDNARLIFRHQQLISATIDGKSIEDDKIYTIVTLDYLADGNDGMDAMVKAESIEQTGVILREYMIDYITAQTAEGKAISSQLDDRIIIQ